MSSAPLIVGQCGKEVNMEVVIGVDPHKGTNAVAVLNDREQLLEYAVFVTNRAGLRSLARWAKRFGERRWAVEGASGLGRPVAQHLVAAGETVVDVPAKLSSRIRLLSVGNERKNDQVDAICVAVAALRVKRLTEVGEEEQATVLRMLSERRKDLMKERTRTLNRLHGLLRDLVPGGAPKNLSAHKKAALLLRGVRPRVDPALTRRRLAADLIGDVRRLDRRLSDLERYIREGVEQASTGLTGLFGVGPILAAKIIGEVGTIARFPTKAHFASYTGTAPIEASSADVVRHRLSRAGNRQLNHALHLIAICQIRHDKDRLITGASSPKASPRKKRCVVSSGESRMRSSRSYTRTWRVESRTWLDTQRGLFQFGPAFLFPAFYGLFISLIRPALGLLQTQSQSFEQTAYVCRVVDDAKLFSDHLSHPLTRLYISSKTVRWCSLGQQLGQSGAFFLAQARRRPGSNPALQALHAAFASALDPLAYGSFGYAQSIGYLLLVPSLFF
jgi:transposase